MPLLLPSLVQGWRRSPSYFRLSRLLVPVERSTIKQGGGSVLNSVLEWSALVLGGFLVDALGCM
uniref:Uncharacterized protein n=1 Tax=Physcomitrium patens TaxID=3218 RepID=A0A2K1IX06_PHYPA|nr:hypothetical protein PHYPA_023620 [Physcomitrium patens]